MKHTKITLSNGQVRWYEGPRRFAEHVARRQQVDVARMEEMDVVRLQFYGWVPAKPAAELQVGDVIGFNRGYRAEVVAIEEASPAYLNVTLHGETGAVEKVDGRYRHVVKTWTQRKKKTGMVPLMQD